MKKKYAGYINLGELNGIIYPSSVQNMIMKDYVENNLNGIFYLSPTEILQSKHPLTLLTLIGKETSVAGIVMISSFLLPNNKKMRDKIYKKLLKSKKKLIFILDELQVNSKRDINNVEELLLFNQKFFTQTKKKLNKHELNFVSEFKKISFV